MGPREEIAIKMIDKLQACVRELEEENTRLRDAMARAGDFCARPTACGNLLNTARARDIAKEDTH